MDWSEIINQLLKLLAMVVLGLISAYVIPWISAKKEEAKAKAESEGWTNQLNMIEKFVASAEQLASANGFTCEWKKEYVVNLIEDTLGIEVTDEVESYIESAVLMLHKELSTEE